MTTNPYQSPWEAGDEPPPQSTASWHKTFVVIILGPIIAGACILLIFLAMVVVDYLRR